jgi:ERCC4-type nuclease
VQPATLATGDYSLAGLEQQCAIERKSLADWTHTVIHDAERWHRELQRLSALTTAVIVVEAGLPDVFAQHQRSAAAPRAILGRALSAQVDYQVPVFFAGDRPHARLWATAWLARTARRLHGKDIS